jgi:hypothetical protein
MWHHNVDLLAYHDLDGRSGFKLAMQEVDGRFFLYVAGFWHAGWSILDVTDPEHPELLRWLDGPPNTMTIQVQVADGTMITALEHPPPGLTIGDPNAAPQDGFLIWDVREPDWPQLLGQWVSGGTGTHRNFYNGGPWVYATSNLPGFDGQILAIVDIADPANPKIAGTWWHPGQHKAAGETYTPEDQRRLTAGRPYPQHGLSLHGGAYALGDRAYRPWMRGGMVILDIADKHHPKHVSTLPVYPPLGSTIAVHSAVPLPGRDVVVINDEALAARVLRRTRLLRRDRRHLRRVRPDPDGPVPPAAAAPGIRRAELLRQGRPARAAQPAPAAGTGLSGTQRPARLPRLLQRRPADLRRQRSPRPAHHRLLHPRRPQTAPRANTVQARPPGPRRPGRPPRRDLHVRRQQRHLHPRPPPQSPVITADHGLSEQEKNMNIPTGIDTNAPVIAHHEIDINAPLDTVWRLHTDVNNWPTWQTDITAARLDGPFQPGNSFTWTSYGSFTVTSTVYAVAERARTLWGGPA